MLIIAVFGVDLKRSCFLTFLFMPPKYMFAFPSNDVPYPDVAVVASRDCNCARSSYIAYRVVMSLECSSMIWIIYWVLYDDQ